MISALWLLLTIPAFWGGMILMACLSVSKDSAPDMKKSDNLKVIKTQDEKEVKP